MSFSIGFCPEEGVSNPTHVGTEVFLGVDLTIRLVSNRQSDDRPTFPVDSFLADLSSGPYNCMVASTVFGKGKELGYNFSIEDEVEIGRIVA